MENVLGRRLQIDARVVRIFLHKRRGVVTEFLPLLRDAHLHQRSTISNYGLFYFFEHARVALVRSCKVLFLDILCLGIAIFVTFTITVTFGIFVG